MYYDLLAKIKNAGRAKKEAVFTPFSKMDFEIAKILVEKKYLTDVQKKNIDRKSFMEVKLAYRDGEPAISDFKIRSKPGRRFYIGYRDLRPVKGSYGLAILSTPKGIMENRGAKKTKVGGEYLFEIW